MNVMNLSDLAQDGEERSNSLPAPTSSMGSEEARAIAQVQGAMAIAKRFPRDENLAMAKIMRTCKVIEFAEEAEYGYKRGNTTVTGASIRLLEVCAQSWGNIEFSVAELARGDGESLAMTYAVELESNTWARRQFVVPHRRDKSDGGKDLTSDRDIYEIVANMGSRRVRACLEQVIPKYVVDAALEECRKTKRERDAKTPLAERVKQIIASFAERNVTLPQLMKWLKRPLTEMKEIEYQQLKAIYQGIKNGLTTVDEHFEPATVADSINARKGNQGTAGTRAAAGAQSGGAGQGGSAGAAPPASQRTGGGSGGGNAPSGSNGTAGSVEQGAGAVRGAVGERSTQPAGTIPTGGVPDAGNQPAADARGDHSVGAEGQQTARPEASGEGRFDDDWDLEKVQREIEEEAAAAAEPTKDSILKEIEAAKSVDTLNALRQKIAKLSEDDKRVCSKAAFARVKAIAAAHQAGGQQA